MENKNLQIDWINVFDNLDTQIQIKPEAFLTNTTQQEQNYVIQSAKSVMLQRLLKLKKDILYLSDASKVEFLNTIEILKPTPVKTESTAFNQSVFEANRIFSEFLINYKAHLVKYLSNQTTLHINEIEKELADKEIKKYELLLNNYLQNVPLDLIVEGKQLTKKFSVNTTIREVCDALKAKEELQNTYKTKKINSPDWQTTLKQWIDEIETGYWNFSNLEQYYNSIFYTTYHNIINGDNPRLYYFIKELCVYPQYGNKIEKTVSVYIEENLTDIAKGVAMAYFLPQLKDELHSLKTAIPNTWVMENIKGMIINPTDDFIKLKQTRLDLYEKKKTEFISERQEKGLPITDFELNSFYIIWLEKEVKVIEKWLSERYPNGLEKKYQKTASTQIEIKKYKDFVIKEIQQNVLDGISTEESLKQKFVFINYLNKYENEGIKFDFFINEESIIQADNATFISQTSSNIIADTGMTLRFYNRRWQERQTLFIESDFIKDELGFLNTFHESIKKGFESQFYPLLKLLKVKSEPTNGKTKEKIKILQPNTNQKRESTTNRYKDYVTMYNNLTRNKKQPHNKAVKETCDKFNISAKTLDRAIKHI